MVRRRQPLHRRHRARRLPRGRSVRSRSSTRYARDQPDDFDRWKDALQTDVSRIEQFLALQTGGRRALRFDMGTECGPQYVDIQVVRLPANRSAYVSGSDDDNFYAVADDVATRRSTRPRATCSSSPTA